MIGIDTNILVRVITRDAPKQAEKIEKFFIETQRKGRLFISDIVLIELIWVLSYSYNYTKTQIVEVLRRIINNRGFAFHDWDALEEALSLFENGKAQFSDYVIKTSSERIGCKKTVSLDKQMIKEGLFEAL